MIDVINVLMILFLFTIFNIVFTYIFQLNRYEFMISSKAIIQKYGLSIGLLLLGDAVLLGLVNINIIAFFVIFLLINFIKIVILLRCISRLFYKSKLKYTNRVIRLICINLIIIGLILIALYFLYRNAILLHTIIVILSYLLGYFLSKFVEYLISKMYIYVTRKKLKNYTNIKIIGITGSCGKTSTKHILYNILKEKYIVKATPKSYNTPMGITKFILAEDLSQVEILIIEMGAVRLGDIKKLCGIVNVDIGIITNIGTQHLESFGSIENIFKGKMELADYIEYNNKQLIINVNNVKMLKYVCNRNVNVTIIYDNKYDNDDNLYNNNQTNHKINICKYTIEKIDKNGIKFKYYDSQTKKVEYLSTMLLGVHNVENISVAIACARLFDIDYDTIIKVVKKLQPVENRLQLKKSKAGADIIFDAYNSNEESFKKMIDVVKLFDAKYKILITPGVVELKDKQYDVNYNLAKLSSSVFNEIWIINNVNKYAFLDAINNCKTDVKIKSFEKLDSNIFQAVNNFNSDNLVVFENDLPDSYL